MKQLAILGSTGSIGTTVLKIVKQFSDRFHVGVLAADTNIDLLAAQIETFRPDVAVVGNAERASALKRKISCSSQTDIMYGARGYAQAAEMPGVDMVVVAVVGAAGLVPTLQAIEAGKDVALANKETLVMAGEMVMKHAARRQVNILPIDSEHSAVFQCLAGHPKQELDKILLTASGGPFLHTPGQLMAGITPDDALSHPTWQMGRKITIDSATLMNKGLEVIEAKHLFDVELNRIDVVVHPQSIVHSMVSYCDGTLIAQLGIPDMKAAVAYALSFPERLALKQPLPDFSQLGSLTFEAPDLQKFPCLSLAMDACRAGGTMPAVMNAANEIAVDRFLKKRISFLHIPRIIGDVMEAHGASPHPTLSAILDADRWAREKALDVACQICH